MIRADLAELNAFALVADKRSFRAAARALGVTPSALSHTIRNLETKLDVRLLNRTTRSVALTEAGDQLLRGARPAMADLEHAVNEAASARDRPSGTIRISAAEAGARPLVRHVLPEFLERYPDVKVEIVVDTRMVDIVAAGFDAGVRLADDVPQDMVAIPFGGPWRFLAAASPDYLKWAGRPASPADLLGHRCVKFRFLSGTLYPWDLEKGGVEATIDVEGPMTLGNTNLMLEAALAGIGIAWLPEGLAWEHLVAGRLVPILPEWSRTMPGACLYHPANRRPPTALRLFCEAVRRWNGKETRPAAVPAVATGT